MPSYEVSANNLMYQFLPGELFCQGMEALGAAGTKSPFVIPSNFYAEPEGQKMRPDAHFPTHAVPLRASLQLYDTTMELGGGLLFPEVDSSSSEAVYQAPRTWRDPIVYHFIESVEPTKAPPPFQKHTLYVWRQLS